MLDTAGCEHGDGGVAEMSGYFPRNFGLVANDLPVQVHYSKYGVRDGIPGASPTGDSLGFLKSISRILFVAIGRGLRWEM